MTTVMVVTTNFIIKQSGQDSLPVVSAPNYTRRKTYHILYE